VIRHARVTVWPQVGDEAYPLGRSEVLVQSGQASGRGHFLKRVRSQVIVTHQRSESQVICLSEHTLPEAETLALNLLRGWLVSRINQLEPPPATTVWGEVVRSYQRHREQGVRDVRSEMVIKSVRHVLAGRIDPFLLAGLARRAEAARTR
jgi:protein subunit release factor B